MIVSRRQVFRQVDREVQTLSFGHVAECPQAEIAQLAQSDAAHLHIHLAGFDLAQIENVVNQSQQVGARRVDRFRIFDLFRRQDVLAVLSQHLSEDQQVIQRRAQLMAHIGQELALILRRERQLFGLLFKRGLGLLDLAVLGFDFVLLFGQQVRLFLQLGVCLLELFGQRLALLEAVVPSAWWRRWCSTRCRYSA